MRERLYRSRENKVIGGICGGLGEYFDVDPVLVRIIAVILGLATGYGIIAYIVAWIIIPQRELGTTPNNGPAEGSAASSEPSASFTTEPRQFSPWSRYLPGIVLIGIGAVLLIRDNWIWFDFEELWPVLLIMVGLFLIFRKFRRSESTNAKDATDSRVHHNGGTV